MSQAEGEIGNGRTSSHRVLAIVPTDLLGEEPVEEIRRAAGGNGFELRVVVPAVEANAFRHTMGDIDEPKREAEERLRRVLATLEAHGIAAAGEVGDPDPVQAAQDSLLKAPADEVLIFEHEEDQARWFEEGLLEKAQAGIDPPLRMVVLHDDRDGSERVVDVERSGRGTVDLAEGHEVGSAYLPGLSRGDFAGIVVAIVGTIVVGVLAAAVAAEDGGTGGKEAIAILIAIGIALVNLAHVVGLTLMESVRYRGGFNKFFRYLSLVGTPVAVVVNFILLLS